MKKYTLKNIWLLFRQTGKGFLKDKVPKLCASLSFYTIFSMGPVLLIVIFLAKLFYGEKAIQGALVGQLKDLVGENAAIQIQTMIQNAAITGNVLTTVISFVALLIGATTVFSEIQDSINSIWRLKIKDSAGWKATIKNRLLSFSLVISLGFLLLVSLVLNGLIEVMMGALQQRFPKITVILLYLINLLITLLITSSLFAIIFKVLPDAIIKWSDVIIGAIFTAVLFMVGKFGISLYIGQSNIGSTYGAAGSLVVLLLWVYYSSMILYFGAEFTKAYAMRFGNAIRPNDYATTFQAYMVESNKATVQENDGEEQQQEAQQKKQQREAGKKSG